MKERIITGLIGGIAFLFFVWYGGVPYSIFLLILAVVGYYEFLKMNDTIIYSAEGLVGVFIVIMIIFIENQNTYFTYISFKYIILTAIVLMLILTVIKKNKVSFDHVSKLLVGALYISLGFSYMLTTRLVSNGLNLTLLILLITWATDSGAYFVGKNFGKHKLWPQISPKKTIEGSIGGIILALLVGLIANYILHAFAYTFTIEIALIISIVGQLGDLVESALKRAKNVKDSGRLLPGHGGVLDRFDSLIFIFLVLHIIHFY